MDLITDQMSFLLTNQQPQSTAGWRYSSVTSVHNGSGALCWLPYPLASTFKAASLQW